jgi:polyisoprenoid-binding protein YceI
MILSKIVTLPQLLLNWKGTMVGMYSHSGDIKLSNGSLLLAGDQVKGGTFTVDMKSINPTDSAYSPEHPRADLIGHLGTGDFFSVDSIPTATFTIKSVEGNVATGDLTVKGKTNEEKLQIESVEVADKKVTAKGKLTFNRQNYGVAYKATMKDMVLSDDIELMVTVIANQ